MPMDFFKVIYDRDKISVMLCLATDLPVQGYR